MKIIIYNHRDQYALSRKQLECIRAILPKEYFHPIKEFRLLHDQRNSEAFEYCQSDKTVWFSFMVKEKTPEVISQAVKELLIGLARIKAKSKFYQPLKEQERNEYEPFVKKWLPKCLEATHKLQDDA